jgi:hypothetical protein
MGSAGRAPSLRVIPWHLPCNSGKSRKNQKISASSWSHYTHMSRCTVNKTKYVTWSAPGHRAPGPFRTVPGHVYRLYTLPPSSPTPHASRADLCPWYNRGKANSCTPPPPPVHKNLQKKKMRSLQYCYSNKFIELTVGASRVLMSYIFFITPLFIPSV